MADYTEHEDYILTLPTPSESATKSGDLVKDEANTLSLPAISESATKSGDLVSLETNALTLPAASEDTPVAISLADSVDCVFLYDDSITTYTDYTTEANEDTADDVPLTTANPASVGDAVYIGDDADFDWVWINVTTAGTHSLNFVAKYWDGDSWEEIPYIVADSRFTGYTAFETLGYSNLGFVIPDDRAKTTVNGENKYWVKLENTQGTFVSTIPLAGRVKVGSAAQELTLDISDSMSFSESFASAESVVFSDSVSIADSIAFAISTYLSDSMTLSDAVAFGQSLALSDSMTFNEVLVFTDALIISDSLTMSDTIKFLINAIIEDSLLMSESQSFDIAMGLNDSLSIADSFAFGNHIFINDTVAINDIIVTALSLVQALSDTVIVSDVTAFAFNMPLSDSISISDSVEIAYNLRLSDNVNIADETKFALDTVLSSVVSIIDAIQHAIVYGGSIPGQKTIAALLADPDAYELEWMPYVAIGASDVQSDEPVTLALWDELFRKRGVVSVKNNTYFVRATFGVDSTKTFLILG